MHTVQRVLSQIINMHAHNQSLHNAYSGFLQHLNTETERVKNKRQRNLFIERLHCCDNLNCESLCVGLFCFFVNTRPLILFNRNFEMFIFFVSFEMEN